ncbi:MAG: hypothetical protein JWN04_912 [Myxococcaceae bacterium]|nr:hypothetical protein [Myxococcaceae bacterium]
MFGLCRPGQTSRVVRRYAAAIAQTTQELSGKDADAKTGYAKKLRVTFIPSKSKKWQRSIESPAARFPWESRMR